MDTFIGPFKPIRLPSHKLPAAMPNALNCLFQAELALEMGGKLPVSDRRE
jgi:hypothetical protein